ncbi:hypothetical protein DBZ36_12355 [Alginatibacterium sediminis]|uniref:Outer membrane protein beta-barrel domain-containing protein n=1 Tax=Alginatibacterium sediminis TaxID=2164068 RepID=A0A420EBF6_9ALTE|nr:hypothetical protein [Alginatibacterium sediminis]RKF18029.1 hypothetical protein DBZ36_12355 [Alginatibacterium sediminis]
MSIRIALLICLVAAPSWADQKHQEDPTKIVTKIGVGYNDEFSLSGSIGLDATRMLNARINEDASEWRLGGSWLFELGILNFNFSRSEYDDGGSKNNYSLGTYVPLSTFGIEPYGWMIFPMAGYSYNDGEFATTTSDPNLGLETTYIPNTSQGAYLGFFTIKPLAHEFSLMSFGGASKGTDNYGGYWLGAGLSYKINTNQSVNGYGFVSDDDFGRKQKIGLSYSYQFN